MGSPLEGRSKGHSSRERTDAIINTARTRHYIISYSFFRPSNCYAGHCHTEIVFFQTLPHPLVRSHYRRHMAERDFLSCVTFLIIASFIISYFLFFISVFRSPSVLKCINRYYNSMTMMMMMQRWPKQIATVQTAHPLLSDQRPWALT